MISITNLESHLNQSTDVRIALDFEDFKCIANLTLYSVDIGTVTTVTCSEILHFNLEQEDSESPVYALHQISIRQESAKKISSQLQLQRTIPFEDELWNLKIEGTGIYLAIICEKTVTDTRPINSEDKWYGN